MATVYQAADLALGRTVAVKLFRMDTSDDSGPQRQSGEVMVLASLNHFALVTLFDAGTERIDDVTRSFIVMEYIDGFDLRSRIDDGPMAPAEVARLGADLAEALHYVHAKGIIHRDIKPANVLLAPTDFPGRVSHAKLADFGIARLFDATHLTRTGSVLGTAGYLSPEQALGEPIGPPSDVYSLGLVLLESLTATRSFPGTAIESAMARLQRQPEIPAALGPAWRSVLEAMTTRDPQDRIRSEDAAVRLRELAQSDGGAIEAAAHPAAADGWADEPTVAMPASPAAGADEPTVAMTAAFAGSEQPTMVMPTSPDRADRADEPTMVLRTASTQGAAPLVAPSQSAQFPGTGFAGTSPGSPRSAPRRRPFILGAVLVGILALVAVLFLVQPQSPAADQPAYPAVEGDLGVHLEQLQESVQP
jgi:hypothetical protein